MEEIHYVCSYSTGEYDDYREKNIFVTNNEMLAKLWVYRMNKIIPKVKERYENIYKLLEEQGRIMSFYQHYDTDNRYESCTFNNARYDKIEFRIKTR